MSALPSATLAGAASLPPVGDHALADHLVLDAEALGELHQVLDRCAAELRIGVGDRVRLDQRLLHRLGRRDVGRRRAVADHHAEADAAEVDAAAGRDLAGLLQLRHQRRRDDDEVGRLAGRDGVAQLPGRADGEVELQSALPRIVVDHAADDAAHGAGGDDIELGRAGGRGIAIMAAVTIIARGAEREP